VGNREACGVSAIKKQTLMQAIKVMAETAADPGRWKTYQKKLSASDDADLLVSAWVATKTALLNVGAPRCNELLTEEVAVLCERGKRQMSDVLRKEFRDRDEFKEGVDYDKVNVKRARVNPNSGEDISKTEKVWGYRRGAVWPQWWAEYIDRVGGNRAEVAEKRWSHSKAQRLVAKRAEHLAAVRAIEDELAGVCAFVDRTTQSLIAVTRDPQPFIVSRTGQVIDHAWLPIDTADEIVAHLDDGAFIEEMTLDDALHRSWVELARWDTWRAVWDQTMTNASVALDKRRALDRETRTASFDLPMKPSRDRERS
jgi:hypothetical protein